MGCFVLQGMAHAARPQVSQAGQFGERYAQEPRLIGRRLRGGRPGVWQAGSPWRPAAAVLQWHGAAGDGRQRVALPIAVAANHVRRRAVVASWFGDHHLGPAPLPPLTAWRPGGVQQLQEGNREETGSGH